MKKYIIPIFIPHLGCPYDCIYCNQKTIAAQNEAPRPWQVPAIIESYLQTMPSTATVEVAFFGGSFTALEADVQRAYLREVLPFCQQGGISGIRISTRPDYINNQILDLLKDYQVNTIELGVQSLSEKVLQASSRNYTPAQVSLSSRLIKSYDIDLGIQLMVGLPQDSYCQDMETTRLVIGERPQAVRIYPTLVIAGTGLEAMWRCHQYIPLGLDEATEVCRDMFMQFQRENIPVIRMGLYPSEELRREGNILAGPFHPSFGELVEQAVFEQQARQLIGTYLRRQDQVDGINLYTDPRDLSKVTGRKRWIPQQLSQATGIRIAKIQGVSGSDRNWLGISRAGDQKPELVLTRPEFLAGMVFPSVPSRVKQEESSVSQEVGN